MSEEFFEAYFSKWRRHFDWLEQIERRSNKLNSLQFVKEYFDYIENSPKEYEYELSFHGGKTGYDAYKQDVLAGKYHIYICNPKEGTVTIVPAGDDKPGTINGRLLRNEN